MSRQKQRKGHQAPKQLTLVGWSQSPWHLSMGCGGEGPSFTAGMGIHEGDEEGISDGCIDGLMDGALEGCSEGISLGSVDGSEDGNVLLEG